MGAEEAVAAQAYKCSRARLPAEEAVAARAQVFKCSRARLIIEEAVAAQVSMSSPAVVIVRL